MSSWAVSACYPRRTFYPLSDGPSTQNHRITMTVFRLCSTCQSHSQASLCHCTLRTISDRSELTVARLRYNLGGDRQSNYPPYNVLMPDNGYQLDIKKTKEVFHWRLHKLTPLYQCLPPMLNMFFLIPM